MEFCADHWDSLRSAVRLHGMWDLQVHEKADTEQMLRNINGEYRADDNKELFDAVLASQMLVFQHALDAGGLRLLFAAGEADGELCPLCKGHADGHNVNHWIHSACNQVRDNALRQGVLKETRH